MLTASDIIEFKKQAESLFRELNGYALFTTMEKQVEFMIEADHSGHMTASGYVLGDVFLGNRLFFNIKFDQTFLPKTIDEINRALRQLGPWDDPYLPPQQETVCTRTAVCESVNGLCQFWTARPGREEKCRGYPEL